jgi:hypothetical protein
MKTRREFLALSPALLLPACGGGGDSAPITSTVPNPTPPGSSPVVGPAWAGFARDAQHTSLSVVAAQPIDRILWQTSVDLAPLLSGTSLLAHYGSPVVTERNVVLLGVKTGSTGAWRIEARAGANGGLVWSAATDYVRAPGSAWLPSYNLALSASGRLYAPAAGGKLLVNDDPNAPTGTLRSLHFYGAALYNAIGPILDQRVFINTPITTDANGTVFFGFIVVGETPATVSAQFPANLQSGIARIDAAGNGSWVTAAVAAQDAAIGKVATNSAPALSADGRTLYVLANTAPVPGFIPSGKLLALDAATLATRAIAPLIDPASGTDAWVNDNGTSSPMVGPDGDVYIGVLESNAPAHHFTGWLLHFNSTLDQIKVPGAFGWDNTPSVVPASMVGGYAGGASYLLLSKYNNYGQSGGDGGNRMAILDPNATQADKILGVPVMREVLTQLGPTPDPAVPGGVYEWCVNVAAVDPLTRSVLVNSEDGHLYRWHLATNEFSQRLRLNDGRGQAYTPTAVGPDGVVYSINNATLVAAGR